MEIHIECKSSRQWDDRIIGGVVSGTTMETYKLKDPREAALEESLLDYGYELRSLNLSYDEAKDALQMQVRNVENISLRIVSLLGTNGVLLVVLIALWNTFVNSSVMRIVFFGLAALFLTLSGLCCVWAQQVRALKGAPSPEVLVKKYITWDPDHVKYQHVYEVLRAIQHNASVIDKMSCRLKIAMRLVSLSLFSFLGAFSTFILV